MHLTPNVTGLLRRWGVFAERFGGIDVDALVECNATGEEERGMEFTGKNKMWQHPWQVVPYVRLREKLREVVEDGGSVLHKALVIVDADPENGRLKLADGTEMEADVIIAADGIYVRRYFWH